MKKIILIFGLILSSSIFAQQAVYTDNDGDGIVEYNLINKDGRTIESGYYYEGKMVGTWTSFYPNGKKQFIARFKNGLKHGKWISYDSQGRELFVITYQDGLRTSATQNRYNNN